MASKLAMSSVIFLTCIVCYYNSLYCDFVFDDISAIKDNRDLKPQTPIWNLFYNDFWGTPMHKEQSHKSYRPLTVLTFRWNYMIHQLDPMGYHLVNILLHAITSVLYYSVCHTILASEFTSFMAAILFAIHPIHTEAVTGVVGRAETLSSVFYLSTYLLYVEASKRKKYPGWKHLMLSVVFLGIAMLCKEQGITVAGVCALYEIFVAQKIRPKDLLNSFKLSVASNNSPSSSPKTTANSNNNNNGSLLQAIPADAVKRLAFLFLSTCILLAFRLKIMGSKLPVFTRFDNPASVSEWPARQLTYNYLVSVNALLLLFPCDLCCDWTMGTIPLVESASDPRNLATLFTYAVVAALVYTAITTTNRIKRIVIIMSLALTVLPFLPASNMFFPVGFVVAERVLYMPSMGFCMLVAYGIGLIVERSKSRTVGVLIALLMITHIVKTYTRNWDWSSEYAIFTSGLKVNKLNAKLYNNVGHALEAENRFNEALVYFNKAVSVQHDDIGAHINVGRTYNHLKMYKEAEEAYLKAKSLLPKAKPGESYQARIAPNHLNVLLNLANLIAKNQTRLEEADMLYRQAISMRSDYTQAYINRGDVLLKLNRTKEAQEVYERALFYDTDNPDIYYNLGVVLLEQGKPSQALAYLDKALEFDPDHEQALLNSAILLQELGQASLRKLAEKRLLRLLSNGQKNERVFFNLGMLAMDEGDISAAEHWFRQAILIKEDFRAALFNLALLLADDHRPLQAAPFLNQLVRFHPDHVKALILLGDIYINNIKDLDAAENCYKRILQLEPDNTQGMHNLCVVYVERGLLREAELCLQKAHLMAPHEDYIVKHLKIVQNRLQAKQTSEEVNESRPDSKDVRKTEKDTTRPDPNLKSTKPSTLSLS
ncbi:protein O-mannosyl-transferase Tmtc3 [Daktulosphaira vitifoliae]|uniref:protein O-mannosyl-transferase Tmtc3 n=1 Tax=Daktulosphaira vitifoliae TaxID=58002 RepID=UPI0021AA7164|nr:protein O-mannosyl-transferase Tmtc3 [Daktulosphaira vitifoliae]